MALATRKAGPNEKTVGHGGSVRIGSSSSTEATQLHPSAKLDTMKACCSFTLGEGSVFDFKLPKQQRTIRKTPQKGQHRRYLRVNYEGSYKKFASHRNPSAYPIFLTTEHMNTSTGRSSPRRSVTSFPVVSVSPRAYRKLSSDAA